MFVYEKLYQNENQAQEFNLETKQYNGRVDLLCKLICGKSHHKVFISICCLTIYSAYVLLLTIRLYVE